MAQFLLTDPEFGSICLRLRRGTSRMSARWLNGMVTIVAPLGSKVTQKDLTDFIDRCRPWLRSHRPGAKFDIGQRIDLGDGYFYAIERSSSPHTEGRLTPDRRGIIIAVSDGLDLTAPTISTSINRLILNTSAAFAGPLLIEPCRREAQRLGLSPRSISVSHGHRTLGTCSSRGEIHISKICIFLPPELRRFIFCHELAHLTHHDHSADFHRLADRYLDGREKELALRLKTFAWPVLK